MNEIVKVLGINRNEHTVSVKNLKTGEVFDEPYDKVFAKENRKPFGGMKILKR
jgi:hypothetical protein